MRGQNTGSLTISLGGMLFVLINAETFPTDVGWLVRFLGVLAFGLVLWQAFRTPKRGKAPNRPSPAAWRTFAISVALMWVAIPLGANLLSQQFNLPQLIVLWVVFMVGAHFLPFASVFTAPLFVSLAWTLMGLAAVGVVLTLTVWPTAPSVMAVLAGFVLLGFGLWIARIGRENPVAPQQHA